MELRACEFQWWPLERGEILACGEYIQVVIPCPSHTHTQLSSRVYFNFETDIPNRKITALVKVIMQENNWRRDIDMYNLMGFHSNVRAATYCTLSLTSVWVRIPAWACAKVGSDLGLGGGFRRVLRFPPLPTTG